MALYKSPGKRNQPGFVTYGKQCIFRHPYPFCFLSLSKQAYSINCGQLLANLGKELVFWPCMLGSGLKIDLASACFLQSYSYVMTNIQIHENHMLFVLIFLFLKIFKTKTNKSVLAEHVLISFFAIANLFLFYGLFGSIDKSYYHNILIIIVSIFNLSYFIRKYLTINTHQ